MSASPARQLRTAVPRFAEAAVERARLTVVPRRRVRAPRVPFVTLVSVLLLGGVVGLLCFNTQMQQSSFAATSLDRQAQSLTAREQALEAEIQTLSSAQRVAQIAQRRGMTIPSGSCGFQLATGKVSGACEPAERGNDLPLEPPAPRRPAVLDPAPPAAAVQQPIAGHVADVPDSGGSAE